MRVAIKEFILVIGALSVMGLSSANAVVMDFNSLDGDGEANSAGIANRGLLYTENGFRLDQLSVSDSFGSIHSPSYRFTGSASFYNSVQNGITRLTRVDGGAFDLNSIDLDSLNIPVSVSVTFSGELNGGGTVTQSFTTDNLFPDMETFTFDSTFSNLLNVTWLQDPEYLLYHHFDNIVVGPVPEPTAMALIGLGLGGIIAMRRRRSQAAK